MQKFKALFKRNQRTARDGDRHFEDAEDGVAPAAAKKEEESTPAPLLDPELEPQTASVSVSTTDCTLLINSAGSDCCDTRANVSSNEIKMEEEIRQLKDKIYNLDRVVAEYKLENRDLKELVKILRGYVPQRPEPPCTERPHGGPYTSTVRSSVTSTMSPPDISPIALPASAEEAKFQAPIPNPSQMKRFDMWLEEQQKRATGKLGEEIISSPDTQNSEVSSIVESSLIPLVGSENPVVTDSSLLEDGKNDHPTSPKSVKSDTPSLIESAASELAKPLSEDESISSTVMLDDSATVFEQQCEAEIVETPEKDTTSIFAGEHIVELDSTLTAGTEVLKLQDHLKIVETPEKDTTSIFAGEHIVELDSTVTPGSEVLKLQDHLKKMEESQHSTNEELQATIQELTDLQTQLDVTRSEKEKCKEETSILVDYLYRQTERLQAAQTENNKLQKLLHESASNESAPDREKKLIDLLKQGQVERQDIISENLALTQKLNEAQRAKELTELQNQSLRERVRELEVTVEDVQLEKRAIEDDLQKVKEEQSSHNFEILRLNTLLDLEESKVKELKAAQAAQGNENELFTLINKVLKEKEHIEKKMTETEDVLKRTTCENTRLKQELNTLQEQINKLSEVTASAVSDLENNTKLQKSEQKLSEEKINEMDRKIEGMKQRNSVLYQDLQNVTETLKMNEEKLLITLKQLDDVKSESLQQQLKMESECADLKQLHEDLLVAVRVANEIKTDCQWQLERTQLRVRELEEENAALTAQLDKYNKKEKETVKPLDVFKAPTTPKVPISCTTATTAPPTVPHTLKLSRPSLQCVNVKSLIESIENANKQTKPDSGNGSKAGSPQRESNPPLPLREQPLTCNKQTQQTGPAVISSVLSTASDENKDPLLTLVEKNGGSKRNALLKWVQARVQGYPNIEITNFSSSWTDGLALCALLHTYIPNKIPYNLLTSHNKQHNFRLAFNAAESVGIPTILNITDMVQQERPDWQKVMAYIKEIYTHFEVPD